MRELAARVRASKYLSGRLKRHWLTVLPHLRPDDRERLDAILGGGVPEAGGTAAPTEPGSPAGAAAGGTTRAAAASGTPVE